MRYDVAIIGGGVVGASLAAALQDLRWRIALVDARIPSHNDPRLFGLNYSSCQLLKNIGVWDAISDATSPIHEVHVSRRSQFGAVRLRREDVQLPQLGHVVPAAVLEKALDALLVEQANVDLLRPATLQALQCEASHVNLTLDQAGEKQTIEAEMVVGADGTHSMVRQLMNWSVEQFDYEQCAMVARMTLQRDHRHIAYERFTNDGAIAMLPLPNQEAAMIWTASQETMTELMSLNDSNFLARLQHEFGYRLGRLCAIKKRYTFPLQMLRAKKESADRVMLLGNSAHTLHPIAAQGFNLALYEVATIVEHLMGVLEEQGQVSSLEIHAANDHLYTQQSLSIQFSHQLAKLFANTSLLTTSLLQLGMIGLEMAQPIKKRLLEHLLGRARRVPTLLMSK